MINEYTGRVCTQTVTSKKKKVENNVSIFLLEKNGIFRKVEEKINPQIPTP